MFNSGHEAFLVGGFLRDALRGVKSNDIDFIVKDCPEDIICNLSSKINGKIIKFKEDRLIRIITDEATIDFAELKGNIEEDLSERDFTMNAIAWSPGKGIIDLFGGVKDIRNRLIKGVSEKNFENDPLRLLRAYRFEAELGWKIDKKTRQIIRDLKSYLRFSASERITLEFFKLLNYSNSIYALKHASADSIINELFPIENKQLINNIKAVSRLNAFLKNIPEIYKSTLKQHFSQDLTCLGLLRLETLVQRSNLDENRIRMSRVIYKRLRIINKLLNDYKKNKPVELRYIFKLFNEAGDVVMDFAFQTRKLRLFKEAERFLKIKCLLPIEEVIELTGIKGGPEMGKIISKLKGLQFAGIVKDKAEARRWLSRRKRVININLT